ncbi:MAG TPA: caspase family protein, partial [Anaerolineales bacterium]
MYAILIAENNDAKLRSIYKLSNHACIAAFAGYWKFNHWWGDTMGQRLALIIGNSAYLDGALSRLLTPDADVGALGEILLDPELGGFDDVNVLVNMSSHIIRRSIASFFSKKAREDLLLLYFSGHGVLDDQGHLYLAVRDTDSKLLRGTAISASYITDEMNNSRSQRQLLILDCCHSGAFARGTKG